jgi:hypothetical protein
MALGPIEIIMVAFPENRFTGAILPELQRVVDAGTISVIDGVLATKDADGNTAFVEFDQLDMNHDASALSSLLRENRTLVTDDDVDRLTADLEPNSSAAILVFEHTWVKPLRDAIVESGGVLAANFRVPGLVVEEVLAAAEAEAETAREA